MRKYNLGDVGTFVGGGHWKIIKGDKKPTPNSGEDLVMLVWFPTWAKVGMDCVLTQADFLAENEDFLFRAEDGYEGGEMILRYISNVQKIGAKESYQKIKEARHRKENR